jgi:hypothetical protein
MDHREEQRGPAAEVTPTDASSRACSRVERCLEVGDIYTMKKPRKTAAELEASIKVEMDDICEWPTDMAISVQPEGDSWKVKVLQEGPEDDPEP